MRMNVDTYSQAPQHPNTRAKAPMDAKTPVAAEVLDNAEVLVNAEVLANAEVLVDDKVVGNTDSKALSMLRLQWMTRL